MTQSLKELRGYRFVLHKAYFDKGMSLTSYVKYLIAFFGVASSDVKLTLIIAGFYAVFCYFLGLVWFKYRMIDAETEVGNRFNPFVKEMRQEISGNRLTEKLK